MAVGERVSLRYLLEERGGYVEFLHEAGVPRVLVFAGECRSPDPARKTRHGLPLCWRLVGCLCLARCRQTLASHLCVRLRFAEELRYSSHKGLRVLLDE